MSFSFGPAAEGFVVRRLLAVPLTALLAAVPLPPVAPAAPVPKHLMKDFIGAKAREAPLNTKLVGTGPYVVEEFKPGDLVVYKANPNYRDPNKPFFSNVNLKGGGDAASAARAVLQTGDWDFAWNLQVEPAILNELKESGDKAE